MQMFLFHYGFIKQGNNMSFMRTLEPNKESTADVEGFLLENVKMFANTPVAIKHGLGRKQRGWIITDIDSQATIFRKRAFNAEALVLESTANANINIWVY